MLDREKLNNMPISRFSLTAIQHSAGGLQLQKLDRRGNGLSNGADF